MHHSFIPQLHPSRGSSVRETELEFSPINDYRVQGNCTSNLRISVNSLKLIAEQDESQSKVQTQALLTIQTVLTAKSLLKSRILWIYSCGGKK